MDLLESLRVLRRRWLLVLLAVVAGAAGGWFTAPGESGPPTFEATHSLIVNPGSAAAYNIEQAALLATSGPIPERVGQRLDIDRREVVSRVSAEADKVVSVVRITGRSPDPQQAKALADTTADELVTELSTFGLESYRQELDRLNGVVEVARARVADTEEMAAAFTTADGVVSDQVASAELAAAQADLRSALQTVQSYRSKGSPPAPLETLEVAQSRQLDDGGVNAPDSKPARAILLGGFGLLLGIGAAIGLDRLDLRIHSKKTAEAAFGHPVIAEIPAISRGSEGELMALTKPSSPMVEAYRALRTIVALWEPQGGTDDVGRVVLVTSPMAGEGKTTSVAHLAAMLAEIGRTVMVVSSDFRRPRLHIYFDRPREPGLTDVLLDGAGALTLGDLDLSTDVRGVQLLASGAPVENPASLVEQTADLLRAARGLVDFVLVDSPPLLVANDAVALAQAADGVLIIARAGRTTIDTAQRSAELLERVEVPVVGVVLTAASDTPTAYRYYRYRYYAEPEPKRRWLPWRRRSKPGHPNGAEGKDAANGSDRRVGAAADPAGR